MSSEKKTAVIIGNGPSRKNYTEQQFKDMGSTFGCNSLSHTFAPDYLVAVDPWLQQEIILDGNAEAVANKTDTDYIMQNKCLFRDYEPLPTHGCPPETVADEWKGYKTVFHGARVRHHNVPEGTVNHEGVPVNAESWSYAMTWMMWANEKDPRLGDLMTAHIVFAVNTGNIENLKSKEAGNPLGVRSQGPAGAYAMQGALEKGFEHLIVIGFDALAGEYSTSSEREQTDEHKSQWKQDYDTILSYYPDVTVEWRTE